MFYLLENNRIVCDEELIKKNKKRFSNLKIKVNENKLQFVYFSDKLMNYNVLSYGKIKNQSENVYDLIEVGDLVASYRYSIEGKTNEKEINCVDELYEDENGVGINQCCIVDYDDICAIYKPDSNGDYIKVWEKKEGEQ